MFFEGIYKMQQYNFVIGILAMLLLGFGFLMVFVKKNGFSALTGTYLLTAVTLPLYFFLRSSGIINPESLAADSIEILLYSEFAAAAALIAMGAVLGRLKTFQYGLLAVLIVPSYMLIEWLVTDNGLGLTENFTDTAGSVALHAFGCYFGLGVTLIITSKAARGVSIESSKNSDKFSMIGSMVLWLFWPSFCSAIVPSEEITITAINTILALCGATITTFFTSTFLRKGKIAIADIANASLAGGVAIGSTCNIATPLQSIIIGALSGIICVIGYRFITPLLSKIKVIDTCGVNNLHGMPGILGGLAAIMLTPAIMGDQLIGIVIAVVGAFVLGIVSGLIIRVTGIRKLPYDDKEEFELEDEGEPISSNDVIIEHEKQEEAPKEQINTNYENNNVETNNYFNNEASNESQNNKTDDDLDSDPPISFQPESGTDGV